MNTSGEFVMIMEREAGLPEIYPKVRVGFGLVPLPDKKASASAGYTVYTPRLFFKADVPGDKQSGLEVFATEIHKQKWPDAWAAFQRAEAKPVVTGLLIEEWPPINRSLAMTLKAANIHTVEELAEVSDAHINKIGNMGRELRAKAIAYLKDAKEKAALHQVAAEGARKDAEIAELRRQISDLAKLVQRGQSNFTPEGDIAVPSDMTVHDPTKRRGRPPGSKNKPKETTEAA